MIGYWISFGLIFPIIIISAISFRVYSTKYVTFEVTPETKRRANFLTIKYIFFYFLANLFYMSCFINNITCKFVFGGILILMVFMNLANSLISTNEKSSLTKWALLQDLLIGIGLSIYLMYIIPSNDLKEIVIPVLSAVFGGLITLIGVAWTIKKSEIDRKKDEINKVKPLIFITDPNKTQINEKILFEFNPEHSNKEEFKDGEKYFINYIIIRNADYSFCTIHGLSLNDDLFLVHIGQVLDKGKTYCTSDNISFNYQKEIKHMYLILSDLFDNYYSYELNFKCTLDEKNNYSEIEILSGFKLEKIKLDEREYKMIKVGN